MKTLCHEIFFFWQHFEVKKRFGSLKRQHNKTEKACSRSRANKKALNEQQKLGEIFKFIKLSPSQFEVVANPARDALGIIRESEKQIFRIFTIFRILSKFLGFLEFLVNF